MIYIDSDGVIADFHGAAAKLGAGCLNNDSYRFWSIIEQQKEFFLHLEELPNAVNSVWTLLDNYGFLGVEILTALPRITGNLVTAQRDKTEWFKARFPILQVNCVPKWDQKEHFVKKPWDVLIDDSERNVQAWERKGGIGVLHTSWEDTMKELKKHEGYIRRIKERQT